MFECFLIFFRIFFINSEVCGVMSLQHAFDKESGIGGMSALLEFKLGRVREGSV